MKTRLTVLITLSLVASLSAATRSVHRSFVNGYPAEASRHQTGVQAAPTAFDRLCAKMLPPEKVNAAVGFFAPVAKKYMPDFERFSKAYQSATDKTAVVARHLPVAERALAEARAMRVPPKYEQEKARYLQLFETALLSLKAYVAISQMK